MFRRLLLQGLYRVRGRVFGPLHKVGFASHIRHGNFGEVWKDGQLHLEIEDRDRRFWGLGDHVRHMPPSPTRTPW
jgi:hypothetical protein